VRAVPYGLQNGARAILGIFWRCFGAFAPRWGLEVRQRYKPAWLHNDIPAGLTLAAMLVPVGIAYAVAAGLPGIYGLYATIVRSWSTPCCYSLQQTFIRQ